MLTKIVIVVSFICVVIAVLLSFYGDIYPINIFQSYLPFKKSSKSKNGNVRIFSKEELSEFTGSENSPVYLAILGEVFDVTSGRKHYGDGGGYSFFAGKDATRAYVSGDFTEKGLIENTDDLSYTDLLGLEDWKSFYHKQYKYIGKLAGMFYDENGQATDAMKDFKKRLKLAKKSKQSDEDDRNTYPPCNFEYKQGQGRRIWCSNLSGGVERSWAGRPRQYFRAGKTEPRCACVKDYGAPSGSDSPANNNNRGDLDNPQMKVYEGCDPESSECFFED